SLKCSRKLNDWSARRSSRPWPASQDPSYEPGGAGESTTEGPLRHALTASSSSTQDRRVGSIPSTILPPRTGQVGGGASRALAIADGVLVDVGREPSRERENALPRHRPTSASLRSRSGTRSGITTSSLATPSGQLLTSADRSHLNESSVTGPEGSQRVDQSGEWETQSIRMLMRPAGFSDHVPARVISIPYLPRCTSSNRWSVRSTSSALQPFGKWPAYLFSTGAAHAQASRQNNVGNKRAAMPADNPILSHEGGGRP